MLLYGRLYCPQKIHSELGYQSCLPTPWKNVAYIRLKNLQFGYTLPKPIVSKAKLQNVRVYISAENLWCWSPLYKHTRDLDVTNIYGSDPDLTDADMSSGLNGNRGSGDGNSYPQMKSVSLGLSVTF